MPVHPDAAEFQVAILAGVLGPDRGALAPDAWQVEGWIDNPLSDGAAQADFAGYTPAVWDSDDWAIDDNEIATTSLVSLGTPAGDGTDAIRFWALRSTTTDLLVYSAPLEQKVYVSASANPVQIHPIIRVAT
jgi:hypothetical protein